MTREEWRDRAVAHGVEIAKLKKQLAIAVEALETINVCCDECSLRASYALHEIEELDK